MPIPTKHCVARIAAGLLFCFQIACTSGFAQSGLLTAPRDITQLTARADQVIRGKVINVKTEPHPQYSNLNTVVVTVRVNETLKGTPTEIYAFRQVILGLPQSNSIGYRRGAELILFMHAPNENGVTSPVGADQGRFTVQRDQTGRGTVTNGAGNRGLFGDASVRARISKLKLSSATRSRISSQEAGPVDLDSMQSLVRQLAAGETR